jgi:glutamyl-Q tRNA(Asp) synthetase
VYAAWFARENGSVMALRIEDIDPVRSRDEHRAAIFEDLKWLGITWDGEPLIQSARLTQYRHALKRLEGLGMLYPCFCTRKEILAELQRAAEAPHSPTRYLYPGTCRSLDPRTTTRWKEEGRPYALRLNHELALATVGPLDFLDHGTKRWAVDLSQEGDFVVARKDTPTSYHLSVVVDDADQGVTLVTRGKDLVPATHAQRLLQALLGLPRPEYWHHGLVTDDHGERMAKRAGSLTVRSLRQAGWSPTEVLREALRRVSP